MDSATDYSFAQFANPGRDYLEILPDVQEEWRKLEKNCGVPYIPHVTIGWDNNPLGVPVTNINEGNGKVYFQVSGGTSRWNTIKTLVPENVRDVEATFRAEINSPEVEVKEAGFCYNYANSNSEPQLESAIQVVPSPLLSTICQQSGCPLVQEVKSL